MPIHYKIDKAKRLVIAEGVGTIGPTDIIEHLRMLANDPDYESPMRKLVDYRNIDAIQISAADALGVAAVKKELQKVFIAEKCAFISPGDLTFGTTRVHQSLLESSDIDNEVIRNEEDAMEWLNKAQQIQY